MLSNLRAPKVGLPLSGGPLVSAYTRRAPRPRRVRTARSRRGILTFTHLAREGRMTVIIGRRELLAAFGSAAAAWPLAARAQQPDKTARVGWLAASLDNPVQAVGREVLLSTLRKLGFTEGYNLVLEHRRTDEGMAKALPVPTSWSQRKLTFSSPMA